MQPHLAQAFEAQARACKGLGSAFMARLMGLLPGLLDHAPRLSERYDAWPGDLGASGASLPLRLAGGLHALVLSGQEPGLAALYPPAARSAEPDPALPDTLAEVLARRDAWLCDWVGSAPQTNEVGRSAVLIAAAQLLTERFGLPLKLSELGASAGLNLRFDRYRLICGARAHGPASDVVLKPQWQGHPLPAGEVPVVDRRGVDLNPIDPRRDALRLRAYLWPDQPERRARLDAAMALAADLPAPVDPGDAAAWLEARLEAPTQGACHMVFHTIAFQYFPQETQDRIRRAMARAGETATHEAPLAWVAMEADDVPGGAGLTLRLWPGDLSIALGRAGFHGQWIDWQPRALTDP